MRRPILALSIFIALATNPLLDAVEEPIFSGPQVGEELVPFEALGVLGNLAGKKVDIVGDAKDNPVLLIFVHQITRPSIGLLRTLANFAKSKKKQELKTAIVFLADDRTDMEARIRRMQHALPKNVASLISPEGVEGPGSYGLNRKMTFTVLVGAKGKVLANFPLIQPSIQADALKIGQAIVKATGGKEMPTLKEMGVDPERMMPARRMQAAMDVTYRRMMSPVIQRTATKEEVDKAATEVEQLAAKNQRFKARVAKAAQTIVNSGRLSTYGTEHAQEYLEKWAKEFASTVDEKQDSAAKKDTDAKKGTKSNGSSEKKEESTSSEKPSAAESS